MVSNYNFGETRTFKEAIELIGIGEPQRRIALRDHRRRLCSNFGNRLAKETLKRCLLKFADAKAPAQQDTFARKLAALQTSMRSGQVVIDSMDRRVPLNAAAQWKQKVFSQAPFKEWSQSCSKSVLCR